MSIKLADTLAPMSNDFYAVESENVGIDIDGTSKSIQQAYEDGDLSGGGSSIQMETMPIASSEYEGAIYQYIGDSGTYKKNAWYECIEDSENVGTYIWNYLNIPLKEPIIMNEQSVSTVQDALALIVNRDSGVSDDVVDYVEGEIAEVENKIKSSVTHSFSTQDGKIRYLKLNLNINTISVVDIYGGKIEILGANNSNANPDYKTVKVVRHSYGDWGSYDATQIPSALSTKIGSLYYYPTDNYYYLQLNNYANFTVTGALTKPEAVTELPVATSEMTLIPESAFASKDAFATTNKRVQGATPFYEMYFAESRYRKLTVDLYYGREVTFSVNNLGYEGIISVYSNNDSTSACVVKNIGVRGNPQGNISVKWGNYKALGGSGHYQVDLFIYKVNANNTMIIRPRTQQIDGYTKVYTSADFVASSQTEYEAAEYTAITEYESINDSSTGNAYSTWSSSKIASEIGAKVTKTKYRGSQSIDISTGDKLTFIYSSEYASQAGCYMLLSNFNTEPLLIELGRSNIGSFKVTATHKSNNVDTITVATAGDEYSWCILQF